MVATDRRFGVIGETGTKMPVTAASTGNLTLSGEQTVDGVALVTDDRILVKNQTTTSENGIYVVDTGTWQRAADFDGPYDIVKGSMIYVTDGTSNAGAWFVVSTNNPIEVGTTALSFSRQTINYVVRDSQVASAGQTIFNFGSSYQTGSNGVAVYVNGIRQRVGSDYTETNSTRITFSYALVLNDEVDFYIGSALGSLTASAASTIAVADAGAYFVGTTAEAILQELADPITPDNGDASVTLTNSSSNNIQRWNTALSANRTATLSASNAKEGAHFVCVRGSGATGNYTLAIGTVATLRAPGEWCEVRYDAGTAAWILEKYGILPSVEILAMSDDNGDANATITPGSSARTQRWAAVLTADRTATLSTSGAFSGARFRIVRLESATGGYCLKVVAASSTIARLAIGQFVDVEYTGTAWVVVAFGNVRSTNTHLVTAADDFLGEEINGYLWQTLIGTDATCSQAVVLADQNNGVARLTTGADAGATMALNGVQLQGRLNWSASKGCLSWEADIAISAITSVCVFIGFTDQVAALEMPFTLGAGDALTSNATDAAGVLFDTAADTDNWWLVGVKADVDATKQNTAVAPAAGVSERWRIDIDAASNATFYRNGTAVGTVLADALTASASLAPVVAAFARGAASRTIDIDQIFIQQQR